MFQVLKNSLSASFDISKKPEQIVQTSEGKALRSALRKSLDYYLEKYKYLSNDLLKAITFLDPRFEWLIINFLKNLITTIENLRVRSFSSFDNETASKMQASAISFIIKYAIENNLENPNKSDNLKSTTTPSPAVPAKLSFFDNEVHVLFILKVNFQ